MFRVYGFQGLDFAGRPIGNSRSGSAMFANDDSRRAISLIGLVMLLLTVLGYVGLGIVLKMNGYPDNSFVRWTPIAVSLRQHGHWILLVPILWATYAVISSHIGRGLLSEGVAFVIGIIFLMAILLLYLYAIGYPFSRPLLIYSPSRTSHTTMR